MDYFTKDSTLNPSNFFNVKNFGAVGNGIADDTLAIQKAVFQALNSSGTVYFPKGTYRITTTINCIPIADENIDCGSSHSNTFSEFTCNISGENRESTFIVADFLNWNTSLINSKEVCQYYLPNGTLTEIQEYKSETNVNLTDKIVFLHSCHIHFSDLSIVKKQNDLLNEGIAFSTPYSTTCSFSSFERLNIEAFNYGFWH
ncbi:MAG: glycosyl hydrolase family 28-related protein, partial [Sarcina sp.]